MLNCLIMGLISSQFVIQNIETDKELNICEEKFFQIFFVNIGKGKIIAIPWIILLKYNC